MKVRYFAWVRERVGKPEEDIELPSTITTVADLMAYLAEQYSASEVASALAAYVTGNVACNLFGRLMSASLASSFGLEVNFYVFAALNLAGAVLVFFALKKMSPNSCRRRTDSLKPLAPCSTSSSVSL